MAGEDDVYSNIRQILGWAVGQKIVDITQHDADEFQEDRRCYVMLMLENGGHIKFFVGDDGFIHNDGGQWMEHTRDEDEPLSA